MLGLSCNFNYLSTYLNGKRSFFGLPNIPVFGLGTMVGSACDTITFLSDITTEENIVLQFLNNQLVIHSTHNKLLNILMYNTNAQLIYTKTFDSNITIDKPSCPGFYFYNITSSDMKDNVNGKFCVVPY